MIRRTLKIKNRAGVHARPAALIVQKANTFKSELTMEKGSLTVNAKSIMGIIMMAASYNTEIVLCANGPDEAEAADAIEQLFESKFEED